MKMFRSQFVGTVPLPSPIQMNISAPVKTEGQPFLKAKMLKNTTVDLPSVPAKLALGGRIGVVLRELTC